MTTDLDALEALAKAATPGPWEARTESPSMGGENYTIRQKGVPGIRMSGYVYGFGSGMVEFIAAADPSTVLALIAELRQERERAKPPLSELLTLRSTVEQFDTDFPCDGGCSWDDGPEETCSRHGRKPSDLWNLLDEARATLSRAEQTIKRNE